MFCHSTSYTHECCYLVPLAILNLAFENSCYITFLHVWIALLISQFVTVLMSHKAVSGDQLPRTSEWDAAADATQGLGDSILSLSMTNSIMFTSFRHIVGVVGIEVSPIHLIIWCGSHGYITTTTTAQLLQVIQKHAHLKTPHTSTSFLLLRIAYHSSPHMCLTAFIPKFQPL